MDLSTSEREFMFRILPLAIGLILMLAGEAFAQHRCLSTDAPSRPGVRNVTDPGDVHLKTTDKLVLINKRFLEPTRVIVPHTTAPDRIVTIKDCAGVARRGGEISIVGALDAGRVTIDGNYGLQSIRSLGNIWMIQ